MKPQSRYRRAVKTAMNDTAAQDRAAQLRDLDFGYEALCRLAERRGWTVAVSLRLGQLGLHLFTRPVGRFSFTACDWMLAPVGCQVAGAPVEDLDWDRAACVLWASVDKP